MPNFQISAEILALKEYLATQAPGAKLTYLEISMATGLAMDNRGKSMLRRAAKQIDLEFDAIRGIGIELAAPHNALSIIEGRMNRVSRGAKRAKRCTDNIYHAHFAGLPQDEQAEILRVGSIFGAMLACADQLKVLYRKPKIIAVNCK